MRSTSSAVHWVMSEPSSFSSSLPPPSWWQPFRYGKLARGCADRTRHDRVSAPSVLQAVELLAQTLALGAVTRLVLRRRMPASDWEGMGVAHVGVARLTNRASGFQPSTSWPPPLCSATWPSAQAELSQGRNALRLT